MRTVPMTDQQFAKVVDFLKENDVGESELSDIRQRFEKSRQGA